MNLLKIKWSCITTCQIFDLELHLNIEWFCKKTVSNYVATFPHNDRYFIQQPIVSIYSHTLLMPHNYCCYERKVIMLLKWWIVAVAWLKVRPLGTLHMTINVDIILTQRNSIYILVRSSYIKEENWLTKGIYCAFTRNFFLNLIPFLSSSYVDYQVLTLLRKYCVFWWRDNWLPKTFIFKQSLLTQ